MRRRGAAGIATAIATGLAPGIGTSILTAQLLLGAAAGAHAEAGAVPPAAARPAAQPPAAAGLGAADLDLQSSPSGRALLQRYLGSTQWIVAGTGGVRAYAPPDWRSEAERAAGAARESLPRIAAEIGLGSRSVLPVWIVVSPGGGLLAREAPIWSAAIAQPRRHLIVISGPELRRARLNLEETVAHEVSHLALGVRLGDEGWAPRWLDEGLAMHLSGYERWSDRLAMFGRGPVHLSELVGDFPPQPARAQQAYLESEAAVRRLLRLGPLVPFLDHLAAGAEFDSAFVAAYGVTSGHFADDVYREVSRRWRWLSVLGGSVSLFTLMTLLFIVGALVRMWRARRLRRQWEAAEAGAGAAAVSPGELASGESPRPPEV